MVEEMKEFNWIITKCRAKFKGHKEMNYTFYIVDYTYGEHVIGKHITELRNSGAVRTKYFMNDYGAGRFIATEGGRITLTEAHDKMFVKSVKKYTPKMIDNMLGGSDDKDTQFVQKEL